MGSPTPHRGRDGVLAPNVAGPKGRWLVGNLYDYEQDPIGFLERNQRRYGDVFAMSPRSTVLNDPDLVSEVVTRTNRDYSTDLPRLSSRHNQGRVMGTDGVDEWMAARTHGWRGMTTAVMRAHGERMLVVLDRLLATMKDRPVGEVLRHYGADLAINFCLGPSATSVVDAVAERTARGDLITGSSLTFPTWLPLPRVRAMVRAGHRLNDELLGHIRHRRASPSAQPTDLLDLLLAETADPLDDTQVLAVIKSNLLAGYSAPGIVLAWIVYLLATRPEQAAAVRAEAAALRADTGSVLDDRRLRHTEAFVRETLRLYPPIWLMARKVLHETTLGPLTVRPGHMLVFSPYLLQRDPNRWPEPTMFRTDRWLDGTPLPHRFSYLPFGGGPRVCLGIRLAMYQLVVSTAHLADRYRIEVTGEVRPAPRPLLHPGGLTARLTARVGTPVD